MVKLSTRNKLHLHNKGGYTEDEIAQIESTEFTYTSIRGKSMTEENAIIRLGRQAWAYGVAKATFTRMFVCESKRGNYPVIIRKM